MTWSRSPRILFVDLTFNWPPVGGCWVDAYHVIHELKKRGADVALLCPDFQDYYPRGRVETELPFDRISVAFNRFTFNAATVAHRFRDVVRAEKPDIVFLLDGSFMKGALLRIHDPEKTVLRIYAFDLLCPNLHYYRYHEQAVCTHSYLDNPDECRRCWFRRVPWWVRGLQVATYWPESHPRLHFSQEYIASGALSHAGWNRMCEDLGRIGAVITYNPTIAKLFEPHTRRVEIVPSGVDAERFVPVPGADSSSSAGEATRIFMPGRGNDPLKGLDVLMEAAERLRRGGHNIEVHYTAAIDHPASEDWMVNRGWVDQDALPALYREMDIVAVPSTWIEPFGITALEGMASGLPVVASRIGGLATTTVDGETGFHAEPGSPGELASKLERLVESPELRKRMGDAGRLRAQDVYAWHRIVDRWYVPFIEEFL